MTRAPVAREREDWHNVTIMLLNAVRSFMLANTEFRRAKNAGAQPRLQKAGTRYYLAKRRMFKTFDEINNSPPHHDESGG